MTKTRPQPRPATLFHDLECLLEPQVRRLLDAQPPLPLTGFPLRASDIASAIEVLVTGWPTLGPRTAVVEELLCRYLGVRHAILVSSGGAANLLAMLYLASPHCRVDRRLNPGDEVVVAALGWPTTVTPLLATRCTPVLVDSEPHGYCLDPEALEAAVGERTRAVFITHALGIPCRIERIEKLCRERGLVLIEDCCEALGALHRGTHVGRAGILSTFSFYYSHQVCAIEGGLIATDDAEVAAALRAMRANGYGAHMTADAEGATRDTFHSFPVAGYNFKSTDFNAALLERQVGQLEAVVQQRAQGVEALQRVLLPFLDELEPVEFDHADRPSWFGFPLVLRRGSRIRRTALRRRLHDAGIATRPVMGGNLLEHGFIHAYPHRALPVPRAHQLHEGGLMIGIPERTSDDVADRLASAIEKARTDGGGDE